MPDIVTDVAAELADEIAAAGGMVAPDPADAGAVGRTMFDLPGSTDLAVTVLLPNANLHQAPSQSLVRIRCKRSEKTYLGVVSAGPYAEPDGLKGDSPLLVAVSTHGGGYLPPYHGRVQVTILGEEVGDGLVPPRFRPVPNSPVFVLDAAESGKVLKCGGDVRLGLAVGHEAVEVGAPSGVKAVFPRHTAVLGTTGGGKSNTVAGLVKRATDAGMAVVLLDVEGEYTHLHEPAAEAKMRQALADRGVAPAGVPADRMTVYHLVGRDAANPKHPDLRPFSLQFARLSPYAVMDIIGANDAQQERYLFAYDLCKRLMRKLGMFPAAGADGKPDPKQERIAERVDEFERGWPRMKLSHLLDVVGVCKAKAAKAEFEPYNEVFKTAEARQLVKEFLDPKQMPLIPSSWGKLNSLLWRLNRLKVFDRHGAGARFIGYQDLLTPGVLSVVDLSDAGMTELSNLAIADTLRGIQEAQEAAYRVYEKAKAAGRAAFAPPRTLVVIEEAHEFLSDERVDKMGALFEQVARAAKRGRKRWLGLCFVTQLPAHLPKQVLGLCNSFVLHKLTDPQVVATLRRTVGGVDDGLWDRLPDLAPGQAVASFPHFTRPLLVSVDPAPGKLRMAD
ncbi:MAG: ATP-binding protein [Gemmataceae bacterium]|nr:ATP-binding protein [Gemmataceae bacterium]